MSKEQPLTRHEPPSPRTLAGLAIILLVAAVLVGGTWHYTRERIADNEARRTLTEISTVLPARLYDNEPHKDMVLLDTSAGQPLPVYRARLNGSPVAAVLTVIAPDGYIGPIRMLVGIATDGRVLGVRVTAHKETPGIGAAIAAEPVTWLGGFTGRSLTDPPEPRWTVRADGGDFDAIAGATVSSRATVGGVRQALQYFTTHRDAIFAPLATPNTTP
jgi:electron transport complex protein RnfG